MNLRLPLPLLALLAGCMSRYDDRPAAIPFGQTDIDEMLAHELWPAIDRELRRDPACRHVAVVASVCTTRACTMLFDSPGAELPLSPRNDLDTEDTLRRLISGTHPDTRVMAGRELRSWLGDHGASVTSLFDPASARRLTAMWQAAAVGDAPERVLRVVLVSGRGNGDARLLLSCQVQDVAVGSESPWFHAERQVCLPAPHRFMCDRHVGDDAVASRR